ncbi:MAG: hypothetical protein NTU88_13865 [Armatimonadetes bacterium]|nr:hypothetical protein [Armatimonadota bacterium]
MDPQKMPQVTLGTIDEFKRGLASSAPTRVGGAGTMVLAMPEVSQVQALTAGDPAYRTGTGVVLRPPQMTDPATTSAALVTQADFHQLVTSGIRSNSPSAFVPIAFRTPTNPTYPVVEGIFRGLPYSMHTYMLTVSLFNANASQLRVKIGDTYLPTSGLAVNTATGEVRAVFTYNAGGTNKGVLHVFVFKTGTPLAASWFFKHIQLAQLD